MNYSYTRLGLLTACLLVPSTTIDGSVVKIRSGFDFKGAVVNKKGNWFKNAFTNLRLYKVVDGPNEPGNNNVYMSLEPKEYGSKFTFDPVANKDYDTASIKIELIKDFSLGDLGQGKNISPEDFKKKWNPKKSEYVFIPRKVKYKSRKYYYYHEEITFVDSRFSVADEVVSFNVNGSKEHGKYVSFENQPLTMGHSKAKNPEEKAPVYVSANPQTDKVTEKICSIDEFPKHSSFLHDVLGKDPTKWDITIMGELKFKKQGDTIIEDDDKGMSIVAKVSIGLVALLIATALYYLYNTQAALPKIEVPQQGAPKASKASGPEKPSNFPT